MTLELRDLAYETDATTEHFLSYETTAGYPDRSAGRRSCACRCRARSCPNPTPSPNWPATP
jgi:hypothetical protein